MSSKMDRAGVRTPAQLEQKYALGKLGQSFAQAMGVAEDARETAKKANQEIENMFAKDITMTGTFTNTTDIYIPPGEDERRVIEMHILGESIVPDELIPYYDFNGDGKLNARDLSLAHAMEQGLISANFPTCVDETKPTVAKKSTVTLTIDMKRPDKPIRVAGKNMWGKEFETFLGADADQRLANLESKTLTFLSDAVANYEKVMANWLNLPNRSAWNCAIIAPNSPGMGAAFGFRIDNHGFFVFFDYVHTTAKFVQVVEKEGYPVAASVRDV